MVLNTMKNIYGQIKLSFQDAEQTFNLIYPRRCHWAEFIKAFSLFKTVMNKNILQYNAPEGQLILTQWQRLGKTTERV